MNRVWTYLQIEHPDSASEDGKHLRFERDLKDVPPLARFQKVVTTWRDGMYLKILEKQANLVTDDQDEYARFLLPYRVQVYGKKNESFMNCGNTTVGFNTSI